MFGLRKKQILTDFASIWHHYYIVLDASIDLNSKKRWLYRMLLYTKLNEVFFIAFNCCDMNFWGASISTISRPKAGHMVNNSRTLGQLKWITQPNDRSLSGIGNKDALTWAFDIKYAIFPGWKLQLNWRYHWMHASCCLPLNPYKLHLYHHLPALKLCVWFHELHWHVQERGSHHCRFRDCFCRCYVCWPHFAFRQYQYSPQHDHHQFLLLGKLCVCQERAVSDFISCKSFTAGGSNGSITSGGQTYRATHIVLGENMWDSGIFEHDRALPLVWPWFWYHPSLTHISLNKMDAISQTIFSFALTRMKMFYFDFNFTEVCS